MHLGLIEYKAEVYSYLELALESHWYKFAWGTLQNQEVTKGMISKFLSLLNVISNFSFRLKFTKKATAQ